MILTTIKTDFRGRRHSTSVSLNHLHKDETSSVAGNQNQVTVELQQNKEPRRRRRRHSIQGPSSRTRSPVRRVTKTPEKMSSTKGNHSHCFCASYREMSELTNMKFLAGEPRFCWLLIWGTMPNKSANRNKLRLGWAKLSLT